MRITVFTPTYNRAYTLGRLYESLKNQTFKDFEWLVVDDGSIDNTEQLIKDIISKENVFTISYIKTENGGKHRAMNKGMPYAKGELTLIMDSDDWLREDALELIDRAEKSIPEENKKKYAGVYGLKCYPEGNAVGTTFAGDYLDVSFLERNKHNICGDKAEVYYTHILQQYPFPEFEGEKFVTERLVWSKIAKDGYIIRFFNEKIYFCKYLEDGLTAGGNALYAKNPRQWAAAIKQDFDFEYTSKYNTRIQVYIFYLFTRDTLTKKQMAEYLGFKRSFVTFSVIQQRFVDMARFVLKRGKTVGSTCKK